MGKFSKKRKKTKIKMNGITFVNIDNFNEHSRTISSNIHLIIQKTVEIEKNTKEIGRIQDTLEFRKKLHALQHDTEKIAKRTSNLLKIVNEMSNNERKAKGALTLEMRQRRTEKERLNESFSKALLNFQNAQRMMDKLEKRYSSDTMSDVLDSKEVVTGKLIDIYDIDEDTMQSDSVSGDQKQLQMIEDDKVRQLEEREKEMSQLESDIIDVNTIFKDLSMMVHEQGDVVDSIENNVESTYIQIQDGNQQLKKAAEYKRKTNKLKFFCLSFVIVILVVVIIVITAFYKN